MSNLITVERAAGLLDQMQADLEPLIRESGKSFDRLRAVFMIAVQQNPDILACSEDSIRREVSKCAADGLVPDNKEATMIPYKGVLQYQPMVHGVIKRMKELGGVFNIVCNLVYARDEFVLDEADPDSLSHKADRFSQDRGEVVGGYVIFRDEHKRVMHLETMSADDFEKVRRASKAPDSPAWKNWRDEMYRKAVLRRGAKYISVNNDKIRALIERQDDMFEFNQPKVAERVNPFGGNSDVIEHETARQIENKPGVAVDQAAQTVKSAEKQSAAREAPEATSRAADEAGSGQQMKAEKKAALPAVPDIDVRREDHDKVVEGCEKLLAIALLPDHTWPEKRQSLKGAADLWAVAVPEYAKPLLRACIDATDWAIKQAIEEKPWTGDHAMFVHGVKSLLGVEKLKIGSYP